MDRFDKVFLRTTAIFWILAVVLGLAFWGGLIWLVFYLLNTYGVI